MAASNLQTPTDDEADRIADYSRECYSGYLDEFMGTHRTVSETRSRRVFADADGHELDEWADALDIDREKILAWMHEHDGSGYDWSQSDPVVLLKEF